MLCVAVCPSFEDAEHLFVRLRSAEAVGVGLALLSILFLSIVRGFVRLFLVVLEGVFLSR